MRQDGNGEQLFHDLFSRYYRSVFYFFSHRGVPDEDARELTQETFLSVYKGMGSFRRQARPETWLFQIAANTHRSLVRRRSASRRRGWTIHFEEAPEPERLLAGSVTGGGGENPQEAALAEERVRLLRRAIAQLPPQMRQCLFLRACRDLKYREIAALMKLSVETVKAHLAQGKKRLRRQLGDHYEGFDL